MDASGFAIGTVLFQTDKNGISRPVAFTSWKLQPAERNYPIYEQELLAVVHALCTWRYYLDESHFIVYTDHATLRHFPMQPKLTRRQAWWMELLQEYDFDLKYKCGSENTVPDALSRRPDHSIEDPVELHSIDIQFKPGMRQCLINSVSQLPNRIEYDPYSYSTRFSRIEYWTYSIRLLSNKRLIRFEFYSICPY
jgi:hypothetical protein